MSIEYYKPSELTLQLQQLQLEMSKVLLDFCETHHLKIWACFGTLLGAARHKGFIPWDDDVDFAMMRDDYDKLLEFCNGSSPNLLPQGYSFDASDICVIKLRKNDTTMLLPKLRLDKNINQGVWVDVFCLDIAPDNDEYALQYIPLKRQMRMYRNRSVCSYSSNSSMHFKLAHFALGIYFYFNSLKKQRAKIENFLRNEANRSSGKAIWLWLIRSTVMEANKVKRYDTEWFRSTELLPFEDIKVPCPVGWNELLTAIYGDWHIPIVGTSLHEGCEIDLHKSYLEVINERLSNMSSWERYCHTH